MSCVFGFLLGTLLIIFLAGSIIAGAAEFLGLSYNLRQWARKKFIKEEKKEEENDN